jgi:hypothetical protein
MMKKLYLLGLTALLALALAACNDNEDETTENDSDNNNNENNTAQHDPEQEPQQEFEGNIKVDEDETVAKVNGKEIKGKDFNMIAQQFELMAQQQGQDTSDEEVAEQLEKQVLDSVVNQELLKQDIKSKGYKAPKEDIDARLEEIKSMYEDEDQFKSEFLEAQGMTEEEVVEQTALSIQFEQYMDKEIGEVEISDEDIEAFYNKYKEQSEGQEGAGEMPPLEEVRPQIEQSLQKQEQDRKLAEVVEKLKEDSDVEILI